MAWRTEIPGVGWGSPVVWGQTVFVTAVVSDGNVENPIGGLYRGGERPTSSDVHHWMAYAIDLDTGRIRWETEIYSGVPAQSRHLKNSYASETPVTDGECLYVYFGNVGVFCLDFDGRELWSLEWPPLRTRSGWGTGASPVLHDGRLFYGGQYYTLMDRGFMTAHDARTGEQVYGRRRIAVGTGFTASPWAYNGKIFAISEEGETYVIQAGEEFEVLHTNHLEEFTLATPAIVSSSLLIRTRSTLYRIAER